MNQTTLRKSYYFGGKGLHTGKLVHLTLKPAAAGEGIVFVRTDQGGAVIHALAGNVSSTSRSTELSEGKVSVQTVEHILSALTGLGVDNAVIELDSKEVPILDGSARQYVEAIAPDGLQELTEPRKWIEIPEAVEFRNEKTGTCIRITPADTFSLDVTIDFNSKVLGVQTVHWDLSGDYASEVAPCRTFCFLHEIELLAAVGLVKGGDVENAIVIVEKPVSSRRLALLAKRFHQPELSVTSEGYLSNLVLRFPDECGRHKLLDLIGDLRLCGGFLKAHIEAYKPGHGANTAAAKKVIELINNG